MSSVEPRYRRPLNQEQLEILELLYKFRFGTVSSFKDYFAETNPGMDVFRRLDVLEERGFVIRQYLPDYKLLHKPVVYCLLPEGARELQKHREPDDDAIDIRAVYRNKDVLEPFIMHCLTLFKVYNQLTAQYGDSLDFLSKIDLAGTKDLPKRLPDALLTLQEDGGDKHFFVDVFEDNQPFFAVSKRIKQYIDYKRSGDWAVMGTEFPTILLVCESEGLSERAQKRAKAMINKAWMTSDIAIKAPTLDTLSLGDL